MQILRAFLASFLMAMAFPTLSLWPLAFVSIALLFPVFLKEHHSPKQAAWFFGSFSFGCNLVGFYWLSYTIHEFAEFPWIASVPMTLLLFGLMSLVSAAFGYFWKFVMTKWPVKKFYPKLCLLVLWFVLWDYLDFRLFPWAPMMAVGANDYLLASVGVLGNWGWRPLFFILSALGFVVLFSKRGQKERLIASFALLLILAATMLVGRHHRNELMATYGERQPVALLQGNIGNYEKRQSETGVEPTVRNVLGIYRNLIEEASTVFAESATAETPLEPWYIWPETSFPGFPLRDRAMQAQLDFWVDLSRGMHLVGAYEDGEMEFDGKTKSTEYNIALLLHESRGYVDHYRKIALMPFGEYFPGDFLIPKIYDWVPQVNHFGRGQGPKLLAHPDPKGPVFLPLICYEILFEDLVNEFLSKAAEHYSGREVIIYNPTNDSWFGRTVEPFMHAHLARWQAARVSLPMLRATNTGVSMVVAPWGEILAQGPLFGERVIYAELPVKKAQVRALDE